MRINRVKPQFQFSIQGHQEGLHQNETMKEALHLLRAREVESLRTKTVSVSAFSSLLGDPIQTAGGEMNVQVATKVDEGNKRLIVTIGTPIITIEY